MREPVNIGSDCGVRCLCARRTIREGGKSLGEKDDEVGIGLGEQTERYLDEARSE